VSKYKLKIIEAQLMQQGQQLCAVTGDIEITKEQQIDDEIFLRLDKNGLHVCKANKQELNVRNLYTNFRTRYQKFDLIIKAIQDKSVNRTVIDATAGLAKDALILARYGFKVIMLESNALLVTIVYYAMLTKIIPNTNLTLIYTNSLDYLNSHVKLADVIYIDPMFNDLKPALAKKEMQLIQALVQTNTIQDTLQLFNLAYASAKHKLVVKRDNKLPSLKPELPPTYAISGSTVRFDVYTIK
jgi:16S rRNA G966 N2-methylase RsmD